MGFIWQLREVGGSFSPGKKAQQFVSNKKRKTEEKGKGVANYSLDIVQGVVAKQPAQVTDKHVVRAL